MKDYQIDLIAKIEEAYPHLKGKFVFVYFTKTLDHAKGILACAGESAVFEAVYNGIKDEYYIVRYDQVDKKVL